MTMEALLVTKRSNGTWLGRAGTATDYARTMNAIRRTGERVSAIRWADDDTVHVRHMTGDGRTPYATIHGEADLPAGTTDEEVLAWVTARLT